ncbi:MAG: C45 family peptidase [Candidatus Nomurabacteria bacterium]|jgi:predicted choloylglycine hydrolase|nr:C45 family peptidase [Candidatus Nomurabacteria bacterium]
MKILKFVGSPDKIAAQIGEFYKAEHRVMNNTHISRSIFREQLKIYQKYFPEIIAELKIIAQICGFDEEQFLASSLAENLNMKNIGWRESCTIFGVASGDKLFVGRNYDWVAQARDAFHVYDVAIDGRCQWRGVSDMNTYDVQHKSSKHWSFAPEDAINEKGLFIGLTAAHVTKMNYGLGSTDLIRLVAETCATVSEALALLKKVPWSRPKNYFIADVHGDMAVISGAYGIKEIRRPENGILIQTNHFVGQKLKRYDEIIKNPTHTTFLRYHEAYREIMKKHDDKFNIRDVRRILRDTPYVYTNEGLHRQTIWSILMEMTEKRYKMIYDTAIGETEYDMSLKD